MWIRSYAAQTPQHVHVQCHLLPAPTRLGWDPQSCGSALAGSADTCPALSLGHHELLWSSSCEGVDWIRMPGLGQCVSVTRPAPWAGVGGSRSTMMARTLDRRLYWPQEGERGRRQPLQSRPQTKARCHRLHGKGHVERTGMRETLAVPGPDASEHHAYTAARGKMERGRGAVTVPFPKWL